MERLCSGIQAEAADVLHLRTSVQCPDFKADVNNLRLKEAKRFLTEQPYFFQSCHITG